MDVQVIVRNGDGKDFVTVLRGGLVEEVLNAGERTRLRIGDTVPGCQMCFESFTIDREANEVRIVLEV